MAEVAAEEAPPQPGQAAEGAETEGKTETAAGALPVLGEWLAALGAADAEDAVTQNGFHSVEDLVSSPSLPPILSLSPSPSLSPFLPLSLFGLSLAPAVSLSLSNDAGNRRSVPG